MTEVNLGPLLQTYAPSESKHKTNKMTTIGPAVAGAVLIVIGIGMRIANPEENAGMLYLCGIPGLLLFLVAGYYWGAYQRDMGTSLQLYGNGLSFSRADKTQTMHWDDVTAVTINITNYKMRSGQQVGANYECTLQSNNEQIKFSTHNGGLANMDGLLEQIQQETNKRLWPKIANQFEQGKTINFGDIQANKAGLQLGKQSLNWQEVDKVEMQRGYVVFSHEGKHIRSKKVSETPNAFLLIALANQVLKTSPK